MFVAARKSEVETETEIFNVADAPAGVDSASTLTQAPGARVRANCWAPELDVVVRIEVGAPEHVPEDSFHVPPHVDHVIVSPPLSAVPV